MLFLSLSFRSIILWITTFYLVHRGSCRQKFNEYIKSIKQKFKTKNIGWKGEICEVRNSKRIGSVHHKFFNHYSMMSGCTKKGENENLPQYFTIFYFRLNRCKCQNEKLKTATSFCISFYISNLVNFPNFTGSQYIFLAWITSYLRYFCFAAHGVNYFLSQESCSHHQSCLSTCTFNCFRVLLLS